MYYTLPTSLSPLVKNGSIVSPTPISPPGTAYIRLFFSACNDIILVKIGLHFISPVVLFLFIIPGLISTSSNNCNIPLISVPPAIPPTKF
jgi:hypothetical protein